VAEHPVPWVLVAVPRERHFIPPRPGVLIAETGMGRDRVRASLDQFAKHVNCSRAIFAGFAGGLRPDLGVGDLVWASEVVGADGRRYRSNEPRGNGVLISSDRPVCTPAEKRAVDGDAVDMESAAFAEWCEERAIPWSCVRVISDDANTTLPAELFEIAENGVSIGRLTRAILRRPGLLADLWSLGRATRTAARSLAGAVEEWLRE
jgi:nucleoside phosphorylase